MRSLVILCGACLLLLVSGRLAYAHGGNFRSGNPNPGLPTPPPGTTPRPRGPITPTPRRVIGEGIAFVRYDWATWWQLNAEAWDLPRGVFLLHDRIAITPAEDAPTRGRGAKEAELESERVRRLVLERARNRVVLPYLRSLVAEDSDAPAELVAAALIAWARMASDAEVVPILRRVATDARANLEIRESAVLGLGLLRRTRPELRLETQELEGIRDQLFELFDESGNPTRVRAFAVYALALLADQPYGEGGLESGGRRIARGLWKRLDARYLTPDLPVALLVALGMQPPESVPDGVRTELRRLALKGKPLWTVSMQTHALHTYVRLLAPDRVGVIQYALAQKRSSSPNSMPAAAANALAETAPTLSATERKAAVLWMQKLVPTIQDSRVAGLGVIALGALLGADLRDGATTVLEETKVARYLLRLAHEGDEELRPYAALALAVAARGDRLSSRPAAVFRAEVTKALAQGVGRTRGADAVITPHVMAAGLARAEAARPELIRILSNKHRFPEIRGHAARALGLLGRADEKTLELLLAATRDRVHPCVQAQAVRALGMLAAPGACDELLDQLKQADPSRSVAVAVALALGRLGDPKASDRLVLLAKNARAGARVRSMAVVSLGLIFDPESPPSRARLRTYANYFNLTGQLFAVLGIL